MENPLELFIFLGIVFLVLYIALIVKFFQMAKDLNDLKLGLVSSSIGLKNIYATGISELKQRVERDIFCENFDFCKSYLLNNKYYLMQQMENLNTTNNQKQFINNNISEIDEMLEKVQKAQNK